MYPLSGKQGADGFEEARVGLLLGGNPEDIQLGVILIEQHFRQRFVRWLQWQFPGMSAEDVADTWEETLLCLLQAVREGHFDASLPLEPWLFQLVRARGTDATRRRMTWEKTLAGARWVLDLATGRQRAIPGEVIGREILALFQEVIATLPHRQRLVFQLFVEHHPDASCMEVLRQEVSRVTGQEESLASVKRALQEGRYKVRGFLEGKGYGPEEWD